MPKQRKRDGVYWRKDRRMYWISYVDARGNRQRKPGAESWEEAQQVLREKLARVTKETNLKPGEVPACRDSFADVAKRFLAYQKPRLTRLGRRTTAKRVSQRTSGRSSPNG